MKKLLLITMGFFFFPDHSQAQFHPLTGSALVNIGYANMQVREDETQLGGFNANFQYEYLNARQFLSYGFSISYVEGTGSSTTTNYKYHSWPILFMMKGYLGKEKLRVYVRGQAGVHSTTVKREGNFFRVDAWDTGFSAGGGIGANFLVSDRVFLNLEYNANWLDTDLYDGQIIHVIQFGLGLQGR